MTRTLTIAGTTLAQMGLRMLASSKPYQCAEPKTAYVDVPGSSLMVDGTEFSTGRVEYAAVDSEYVDCAVVPSLKGLADTEAKMREVTRDVVAALEGQQVDIVDSDYPSHWLDARCTVSVTEAPNHAQVRIAWTRQAVRRKTDGSSTLSGFTWTQQSLPYIDGDVDVDACHLLETEPTGLDWTECAWAWDEVTAKPQQPSTTPDTPTDSSRYTPGGMSWDSANKIGTSGTVGAKLVIEYSSSVGCVAADTTCTITIYGNASLVSPSAIVGIVMALDGYTTYTTTVAAYRNQYATIDLTIPAGTTDAKVEFEILEANSSAAIGVADLVDKLENGFMLFGPEYGDPTFDYAGYYEYVDGTGMVDASTLLSPTWALGGVYLPSETVSALPADFHSLYPSPTFSADLLYAAFDEYTTAVTIVNSSSYEYPLRVAANLDCTVELDGRAASIPGTGDTFTTDMPLPDGSSTVNVTVPYSETSDGNAPSIEFTWKRGDL